MQSSLGAKCVIYLRATYCKINEIQFVTNAIREIRRKRNGTHTHEHQQVESKFIVKWHALSKGFIKVQ